MSFASCVLEREKATSDLVYILGIRLETDG